MGDYIPTTDSALMLWAKNILTKLPGHKLSLGLTDTKLATITGHLNNIVTTMQNGTTAETAWNAAVAAKALMEKTEISYMRTVVAQFKTADGYSNIIGKDLGVIGSTTGFDAATYKAVLTAKVVGALIRLKFIKKGIEGVDIYRRKKGSAEWVFLVRDTISPYDDHITLAVPGQPEHYEYRCIGVVKDKQIGHCALVSLNDKRSNRIENFKELLRLVL